MYNTNVRWASRSNIESSKCDTLTNSLICSTVLQSRTNKVHACLSELLEWSDNVMLRREDACVEGAQKILACLQESLQALVDYYDKDNLTRKRPNTANGLSHSKSEWYVIFTELSEWHAIMASCR